MLKPRDMTAVGLRMLAPQQAGEWTNKKPADTGEQQRVGGGVMNPAHRRGVKKTFAQLTGVECKMQQMFPQEVQ